MSEGNNISQREVIAFAVGNGTGAIAFWGLPKLAGLVGGWFSKKPEVAAATAAATAAAAPVIETKKTGTK